VSYSSESCSHLAFLGFFSLTCNFCVLPTNAIYFILQILKEIREEHDRRSDRSTALTPVQLETLASSTAVETEPELMQVKCMSLFFFLFSPQSLYTLILFLRWTNLLLTSRWNNLICRNNKSWQHQR